MTVLLVGADQLGNIPKVLYKQGCENIIHWSGRKKKTVNRTIPGNVDIVVVFSDYVNHRLMGSVKDQAKDLQLPVVFSKRCTSLLKEKLLI